MSREICDWKSRLFHHNSATTHRKYQSAYLLLIATVPVRGRKIDLLLRAGKRRWRKRAELIGLIRSEKVNREERLTSELIEKLKGENVVRISHENGNLYHQRRRYADGSSSGQFVDG